MLSGIAVLWLATLPVFGGTEILPTQLTGVVSGEVVSGLDVTAASLAAVRQCPCLGCPLRVGYFERRGNLTSCGLGAPLACGRPRGAGAAAALLDRGPDPTGLERLLHTGRVLYSQPFAAAQPGSP